MFGARAEKKTKQRVDKAVQDSLRTAELQRVADRAISDYRDAVCLHRELVKEQDATDSYFIHEAEYPISYKVSDGGCRHVGDLFIWAVAAARLKAKEENGYLATPIYRSLITTSIKRGNQHYLRISIVVDRNYIWLRL